jgi:hypothetical protein
MRSGQVAAPSELEYLQRPALSGTAALEREEHDGIGHGGLGDGGDLFARVLAHPEGGDGPCAQPSRELVEERPERLRLVGEGMQGLEAVDHDDARIGLLQQARDACGHPGQAVAIQDEGQILVEDGTADAADVEEAQLLPVPHDLVERLGDRGQVVGGPLRRGVREEVVLRQDRLARPRGPHQQVDG